MDEPTEQFDEATIASMLIAQRAAIMAYIRACLHNHADSEDVFQEVSLVAVRSAAKLRDRKGFVPWVREISRRLILEHRRKSGRMTPLDPELVALMADTAAEVEAETPAKVRAGALQLCLEALPEDQRSMLSLRYADRRMAVEDIAKRFGKSVQATYAILKRSRQLLRSCVTKKLQHDGLA